MKNKKNIRVDPKGSFWSYFKRNYDMYLLLIPGLIFLFIFEYVPLYGIIIAFKEFNMFAGSSMLDAVASSPWVGLKHFESIFQRDEIYQVITNTVLISFYKLVFLFPVPIITAILLNELRIASYKKMLQTMLYLPHFLSWAVVSGLFVTILGSTGIVNVVLEQLIGHKIMFLMDKSVFRSVLVVTDGWKEVGWSSILYLAAIVGIDQETYEAATIDGANKFQRICYITIPSLMPTIIMLFVLRIGKLLDAGFEQIFIMYNPAVYDVADIIGTYVYRIGLGQLNLSLATAVGLFNAVIGFILTMTANKVSRKLAGKSIW